MGAAESKGHHLHRSSKYPRYKHEASRNRRCQHKREEREIVIEHNRNSLPRKNETLGPLITSSPLNPTLHGSILNHSFPVQRAHSEIQIGSYDQPHDEIAESLNPIGYGSYEHPKGAYDYRQHMQRVDEDNRPVLEGLCPDKMYVSTNDLRICDAQRLPPPLRCKASQGFFRSIPPAQFYQKKNTFNGSFL